MALKLIDRLITIFFMKKTIIQTNLNNYQSVSFLQIYDC